MSRSLTMLFALAAYAIFFATFLYLIAFVGNIPVVPRTVDIGPAAAPPPALAITRLVDGDAVDPGLQRRLPAERRQRAEDAEEDFLGEIEGFVTVAEQVQGELEHHALVTRDQLGAGGFFAGGTALNQRCLAGPYLAPPKCSRVFHQSLGDES